MSLRSSLLGALLLGEQYGLQLHGEVVARTARRPPLNVGQVYATLDRLVSAGLVEAGGITTDALTLYALTPRGHDAALAWTVTPVEPLDWGETREHVLLASSLPDQDPAPLVAEYRERWRTAGRAAAAGASLDLGADVALAAVAEAWLGGLALTGRARPLVRARPRRGRRPA